MPDERLSVFVTQTENVHPTQAGTFVDADAQLARSSPRIEESDRVGDHVPTPARPQRHIAPRWRHRAGHRTAHKLRRPVNEPGFPETADQRDSPSPGHVPWASIRRIQALARHEPAGLAAGVSSQGRLWASTAADSVDSPEFVRRERQKLIAQKAAANLTGDRIDRRPDQTSSPRRINSPSISAISANTNFN